MLEDLGATSLEAYAGGAKLSVIDVLRVGIGVASALEHLHKAGLIHKDVSGTTFCQGCGAVILGASTGWCGDVWVN